MLFSFHISLPTIWSLSKGMVWNWDFLSTLQSTERAPKMICQKHCKSISDLATLATLKFPEDILQCILFPFIYFLFEEFIQLSKNTILCITLLFLLTSLDIFTRTGILVFMTANVSSACNRLGVLNKLKDIWKSICKMIIQINEIQS